MYYSLLKGIITSFDKKNFPWWNHPPTCPCLRSWLNLSLRQGTQTYLADSVSLQKFESEKRWSKNPSNPSILRKKASLPCLEDVYLVKHLMWKIDMLNFKFSFRKFVDFHVKLPDVQMFGRWRTFFRSRRVQRCCFFLGWSGCGVEHTLSCVFFNCVTLHVLFFLLCVETLFLWHFLQGQFKRSFVMFFPLW